MYCTSTTSLDYSPECCLAPAAPAGDYTPGFRHHYARTYANSPDRAAPSSVKAPWEPQRSLSGPGGPLGGAAPTEWDRPSQLHDGMAQQGATTANSDKLCLPCSPKNCQDN